MLSLVYRYLCLCTSW